MSGSTWWVFARPDPRIDDVLQQLQILNQALKFYGGHIMAQLDDLKAALAEDSSKLDAVAAAVSGIAAEVADLIARLGNLPPSQDLTDSIDAAKGIGSKLDTVAQALASIPPAPAV